MILSSTARLATSASLCSLSFARDLESAISKFTNAMSSNCFASRSGHSESSVMERIAAISYTLIGLTPFSL
jgi:hypothetical protein